MFQQNLQNMIDFTNILYTRIQGNEELCTFHGNLMYLGHLTAGNITVHNLDTGLVSEPVPHDRFGLLAMLVCADKNIVISNNRERVYSYDFRTKKKVFFHGIVQNCYELIECEDPFVIVVTLREAFLHNRLTGVCVRKFSCDNFNLGSFVYHKTSHALVAKINGTSSFVVWDYSTGAITKVFKRSLSLPAIKIIGFVDAMTVAFLLGCKRIEFWDLARLCLKRTINLEEITDSIKIDACTISSDQRFAIMGDGLGRLTILDMFDESAPINKIHLEGIFYIKHIAVSPTGNFIACCDRDVLTVLRLDTPFAFPVYSDMIDGNKNTESPIIIMSDGRIVEDHKWNATKFSFLRFLSFADMLTIGFFSYCCYLILLTSVFVHFYYSD